jgi:AraC family transcriptional regulator
MTSWGVRVLDESKVMQTDTHSYTGASVEHRQFGGAAITRIMHPPGHRVAPHNHDWPVLALYRIGAYREHAEGGEHVVLDGPSAVFHPAGALHADEIGDAGLETLSIIFDPAWLDQEAGAALPTRSLWRLGGAEASAARALAMTWLAPSASEAAVKTQTSRFVREALAVEPTPRSQPVWLSRLRAALERERVETYALASALGRHPAWLARAYRAFCGEGIGETLRRRRVELATIMLRGASAPIAEIAAATGFCDQSHMNRCFHAVLGRSPLQVRRETELLASVSG